MGEKKVYIHPKAIRFFEKNIFREIKDGKELLETIEGRLLQLHSDDYGIGSNSQAVRNFFTNLVDLLYVLNDEIMLADWVISELENLIKELEKAGFSVYCNVASIKYTDGRQKNFSGETAIIKVAKKE